MVHFVDAGFYLPCIRSGSKADFKSSFVRVSRRILLVLNYPAAALHTGGANLLCERSDTWNLFQKLSQNGGLMDMAQLSQYEVELKYGKDLVNLFKN